MSSLRFFRLSNPSCTLGHTLLAKNIEFFSISAGEIRKTVGCPSYSHMIGVYMDVMGVVPNLYNSGKTTACGMLHALISPLPTREGVRDSQGVKIGDEKN